jgi:hypothetical protein
VRREKEERQVQVADEELRHRKSIDSVEFAPTFAAMEEETLGKQLSRLIPGGKVTAPSEFHCWTARPSWPE